MRYANNSQYKNDRMIRKECFVNPSVLDELKKIIEDCEVMFAFPWSIFLSDIAHLVRIGGWGRTGAPEDANFPKT